VFYSLLVGSGDDLLSGFGPHSLVHVGECGKCGIKPARVHEDYVSDQAECEARRVETECL